MQGQRSNVESLPETFEFDHGSSSNNSGFDQQIYWNNILNQVETQNLPNCNLSPTDVNMSYMNMGNHDSGSLSIWSPGGPSSREHSLNLARHDETKMEHDWTSLTINAGGGPTIEERCFDAANMLSLENVNINLNIHQVDDGQTFPQSSSSSDELQDAEYSSGSAGITHEVSESGLYPSTISGILKHEHAPYASGSSNTCINSPVGGSFMSEDDDDRSSLDGRRLACKRKNIEGFPGQSSTGGIPQNENNILRSIPASHSASTGINLSSSSAYLSFASSSEEQLNPQISSMVRGRVPPDCYPSPSVPGEQLNPRISSMVRGMAPPDCYPSPSVPGNAENSHRNFRLRINSAHQHDISPPNLFAQGSTIRHSSVWLPNQPSSLLIPFNQSLESRPAVSSSNSQSQLHIPIIPGLPRHVHSFPWSGISNPRVGNSSNFIYSEERSTATRDETSSRSISRNNIQEQSVFMPRTDIRHLVQDLTNRNLPGHISRTGNVAPPPRTGISSGLHPPIGPTRVSHQNPPTQYAQSLSDFVRQSLYSLSASDSGGESSNLVQRSGSSSTSQELIHQSGAGFRVHQQPYMRSAFLIERQADGVLGVPLLMRSLAAAREGRSSMISEIRSALDLMSRGENLRFEDIFILHQSIIYGGVDLHDRHRDMRLDVDNMSYEELLALEERIGDVCTGVSEATVFERLKQQKYFPISVEGSAAEEFCCVCQEDYVEGEDLGVLDCRHNFHTACIKQWLTHKNTCPICKTTALVT